MTGTQVKFNVNIVARYETTNGEPPLIRALEYFPVLLTHALTHSHSLTHARTYSINSLACSFIHQIGPDDQRNRRHGYAKPLMRTMGNDRTELRCMMKRDTDARHEVNVLTAMKE